MASGKEKGDVEGGPPGAPPPSYDQINGVHNAYSLPDQAQQYPPQQPSGYPLQHPSQYPSQHASPYPPPQPGTYVYPTAVAVTQPPVQQSMMHVTSMTAGGMPINDYFGLALCVTVCCCLPFGIVALIKSNEVKNRIAAGDLTGAAIASAEARRWAMIGLIFGGVLMIGAFVAGFAGAFIS